RAGVNQVPALSSLRLMPPPATLASCAPQVWPVRACAHRADATVRGRHDGHVRDGLRGTPPRGPSGGPAQPTSLDSPQLAVGRCAGRRPLRLRLAPALVIIATATRPAPA